MNASKSTERCSPFLPRCASYAPGSVALVQNLHTATTTAKVLPHSIIVATALCIACVILPAIRQSSLHIIEHYFVTVTNHSFSSPVTVPCFDTEQGIEWSLKQVDYCNAVKCQVRMSLVEMRYSTN